MPLSNYPVFITVVVTTFVLHRTFQRKFNTTQQMQRWPTVRGKITDIHNQEVYEYEYMVRGQRYQNNKYCCFDLPLNPDKTQIQGYGSMQRSLDVLPEIVAFKKAHTQIGEEIDLFYNPENPKESYLIRLNSVPDSIKLNYHRLLKAALIFGVLSFPLTIVDDVNYLYQYFMT